MDAVTHYKNEFDRLLTQLPGYELAWLRSQREQAIQHFNRLGLPQRKNEHWKYTRLQALQDNAFHVADAPSSAAELTPLLAADSSYVVHFVDGFLASDLPSELAAGIELVSLRDAIARFPNKLSRFIGQQLSPQLDAFDALNTALMQDGLCLFLNEHCQLDKPLEVHYHVANSAISQSLRNVFVAASGAQADIIEYYHGAAESRYFSNVVTEIDVAANAKINHYKMLCEAASAVHIGRVHARCARDAQFRSELYNFAGGLSRSDTQVDLNDRGAHCELNGLYLLDGQQHSDHHTVINHLHPHCTSREYYKGIVADSAQAVFNGRIYVARDAQKTVAELQSKNMLLSNRAEIDAKPELEIYADDVKCAHGATIGQLDNNALFYLQSRGIERSVAQQLLTHAFAEDVLAQVALPNLKPILERLLAEKLATISKDI